MSTTAHESEPLVPLHEVCDRLQTSPSSLRRRAKRDGIPIVKSPVGDRRLRYVRAADLDAYLEGQA